MMVANMLVCQVKKSIGLSSSRRDYAISHNPNLGIRASQPFIILSPDMLDDQ